jgi:hypothetical protein
LPNSFLVAGAADISGNIITGNNNLWAYIWKDVTTIPWKRYLYSFQWTTSSNNSYYARAYDRINTNYLSDPIQNISWNKNQLSFTAESNISRIYIQQNGYLWIGDTLTQNYLNLVEAPWYGTYHNFSDSNIESFTEDTGRNWVGKELWSYGDYTYNGSETPFDLLLWVWNSLDVIIWDSYYWKWKQDVQWDVRTRLRVWVSSSILYQSTTGNFSKIVTAEHTNLYLQCGGTPNLSTGTKISGISVKRVLELP